MGTVIIRVALSVIVASLVGLLGLGTGRPNVARAAEARLCFGDATPYCVESEFLTYWESHGGLDINGYPLTDVFSQRLENGQTYTVQYFERVRMEIHPENPPENRILLGQFGRAMHPADPRVAPAPGAEYFPDTGHNVSGDFLDYWRASGGLRQFGEPLSEEFRETLEDGRSYVVQYFERARFEHHPEKEPRYQVLLGQFGRHVLARMGGAPGSSAPCALNQLTASASWQGAGGALRGSVVLTNQGSAACTLRGRPVLGLRDGGGRLLDVQATLADSSSGSLVTIQPGQRAVALFSWRNWCAAPPVAPLSFTVALLNVPGQRIAPVVDPAGKPQGDTPTCTAPGSPSTLSVSPLQPFDNP